MPFNYNSNGLFRDFVEKILPTVKIHHEYDVYQNKSVELVREEFDKIVIDGIEVDFSNEKYYLNDKLFATYIDFCTGNGEFTFTQLAIDFYKPILKHYFDWLIENHVK